MKEKWENLSRGEGMMTIYCSNTFSFRGEGEGWPPTTKEAKITQTNWKWENGFPFLSSLGGQFLLHYRWITLEDDTKQSSLCLQFVIPVQLIIWYILSNVRRPRKIYTLSGVKFSVLIMHGCNENIKYELTPFCPINTSKQKWGREVGQPDKWEPFGKALSRPSTNFVSRWVTVENICRGNVESSVRNIRGRGGWAGGRTLEFAWFVLGRTLAQKRVFHRTMSVALCNHDHMITCCCCYCCCSAIRLANVRFRLIQWNGDLC